MKMVKGIYVLLTMFLLMGCATVMNPYKMDNRMHKIGVSPKTLWVC